MRQSGKVFALFLVLFGGYLVWAGAVNVQPVEALQLLVQGKDPRTAHPITGTNAVWVNPPTSTGTAGGGTVTV